MRRSQAGQCTLNPSRLRPLPRPQVPTAFASLPRHGRVAPMCVEPTPSLEPPAPPPVHDPRSGTQRPRTPTLRRRYVAGRRLQRDILSMWAGRPGRGVAAARPDVHALPAVGEVRRHLWAAHDLIQSQRAAHRPSHTATGWPHGDRSGGGPRHAQAEGRRGGGRARSRAERRRDCRLQSGTVSPTDRHSMRGGRPSLCGKGAVSSYHHRCHDRLTAIVVGDDAHLV